MTASRDAASGRSTQPREHAVGLVGVERRDRANDAPHLLATHPERVLHEPPKRRLRASALDDGIRRAARCARPRSRLSAAGGTTRARRETAISRVRHGLHVHRQRAVRLAIPARATIRSATSRCTRYTSALGARRFERMKEDRRRDVVRHVADQPERTARELAEVDRRARPPRRSSRDGVARVSLAQAARRARDRTRSRTSRLGARRRAAR